MVFVVLKINATKKSAATAANTKPTTTTNQPPAPVYEVTVGDVDFTIISAQNLGSVIKSKNPQYQPDITTTEKFIKVVIGAQNKSKVNTSQTSWATGNIVDSDGRNFININDKAYYFLPNPNLCGAVLKPDFTPTPCVTYFEVSKASTGLKMEVNDLPGNSSKKKEAYLDLNITN